MKKNAVSSNKKQDTLKPASVVKLDLAQIRAVSGGDGCPTLACHVPPK